MRFVKAIISFLIQLLFPDQPPRCAVCGSLMKDGAELRCGNCSYLVCDKIEYNRHKYKFAGVVAGAVYDLDIKKAVWRIKRTPDERTLRYLAMLMHHSMESYLNGVRYDVIVPVPLNEVRLKERGFNQSEKLAGALSEIIGVSVEANALIRHDDSEVQHTLNKRLRFDNARKSYSATGGDCVRDKTVLLVDDLYTTGATASVCTDRLLEMGAKSVYVAAAAAVPSRQQQTDKIEAI